MSLHKPGQGRNQGVNFAPFGSLVDGTKAVADSGTPEALSSATTCSGVLIQARSGNTGSVFIGDDTNQRYELTGPTFVGVDDLEKVYVRVDTNGDGVNFLYVI